MTTESDPGSGARPPSVMTGPRADAAPISMELATQMLPLVRRIAADLRVAWVAWRSAVTRYDNVLAALADDIDSPLARIAERDVMTRAEEVEALRQELVPLGASCRSPRSGRVEWLTIVDGVPARLVWQPDEERVSRWEVQEPAAEPDIDELEGDDPSRP